MHEYMLSIIKINKCIIFSCRVILHILKCTNRLNVKFIRAYIMTLLTFQKCIFLRKKCIASVTVCFELYPPHPKTNFYALEMSQIKNSARNVKHSK